MIFLAFGAYFLAAGSGYAFGMRIRIRNTDRMNYKVQAYGVDL
jgi:hypothetical protein